VEDPGYLQFLKNVEFFKSHKRHHYIEKLEDPALTLIFGEKKYQDFTPLERKLVDGYQQKRSREGGIMPNTAAALEQEEVEQLLVKRQMKIWDQLTKQEPKDSL
jgi:hypothetical protein